MQLEQAFTPRIFVSDSDFVAITKNGTLCNKQGHLGPKEFENVMREQVNWCKRIESYILR